jgi:hypothetical protein
VARELFIYWRAKASDAAAVLAAAAQMQAGLRLRWPDLSARLYRRAELTDEAITLMETYAVVGADLDASLQGEIERAASVLRPWCVGLRHVEVFDAMGP